MSEDLHRYYERELTFIRRLSQEFAERYPATAGRLLFQKNQQSADPHVERLIEAFALLCGRIQHKLDDQFPELTDALLGVLYPHYLAPIPSCAVVQFDLNPSRADLPKGFPIPAGSRLESQVIEDLNCQFRTVYPVTLQPIKIDQARLMTPPFPRGLTPPPKARAALHLQLSTIGELNFSSLALQSLRLFLSGDRQTVASLYDLLFMHTLQVSFQPPAASTVRDLPTFDFRFDEVVSPVGFGRDEGLLPYPPQSFLGYRLLTEYFAFPSKFHFLDLAGFDHLRNAGYRDKVDVVFYLGRPQTSLESAVSAETFRLGCTPIINLFSKVVEPIPLTQTRAEYRLVPDVSNPDGYEIYSIDSVTGVDPRSREDLEYTPFYSFHRSRHDGSSPAFWVSSRRLSQRKRASGREDDKGTDMFLSLVDTEFDPKQAAESTLVISTTCTNRDLPARLQAAGDRLVFNLAIAAPLLGSPRCLQMPTNPIRSHIRKGSYWGLISHLSLNHLSLTSNSSGLASLQEILRLYELGEDASNESAGSISRQLIDGIVSLESRPGVGRIGDPTGGGFARGVKVTLEFEEQNYLGSGVYLFASVLERFLGLYASINSFIQLSARTTQSRTPFKVWPPRAGESVLE
ncbi:MAG: type VI secretion system baseplate subunit TssF [Isosphaeraceae bacterium]|nr:type VI secretion system baseplate subunit TssF [Isosphaeraceae bacterium]